MEIPINLYSILFDNHFPFQKSVFVIKYILGDVLRKYIQIFEKKNKKQFSAKKNVFLP